MQLSEAVRRARAELGLSQKKLSEMAGIQRRQLATLEGGGNVTLSTLTKVLSQLPNLESFTIQGVTAKVQRNETSEAVLRRYHTAFASVVDIVRDLAEAHNAGRTIGPEKLRRLDEAHYVLQGQLGLTPEDTDELLQAPEDKVHAAAILQRIDPVDSLEDEELLGEAEEE